MSRRAGFTLVELLVVLAILALTAAVAAPAFTQLADADDLGASVTEVRRVLERARLTALHRATRATVVIDPESARFRITSEHAATPDSVIEGAVSLAPGVTFAGIIRRPRVTFDARGTAHGDAIVLAAGGRAATVTADTWSGSIHVRR